MFPVFVLRYPARPGMVSLSDTDTVRKGFGATMPSSLVRYMNMSRTAVSPRWPSQTTSLTKPTRYGD